MPIPIQWLEKRGVTAPQGFRAGAARAQIKTAGDDLALLVGPESSTAAAVFTTNQVKAAPVLVSAAHLASNRARAIIVNAGNANCCTGARGLENARQMAALTARKLGLEPEQVLVCSTGIIGHQLPMEKIETALQTLQLSGEDEVEEKTAAAEPEVSALEALAFVADLSVKDDFADELADAAIRQTEDFDGAAIADESAESQAGHDLDVESSDVAAPSDETDPETDPESSHTQANNDAESEGSITESDNLVGSDDEAELAPEILELSAEATDEAVARAFMTTDTVPKFCAASLEIGGKTVTVGGQAKGVGMIGPDMAPLTLHATLLAFLTTDAQIERSLLQQLLERAVSRSFNSVTVDGDMSTNDTAILLASGQSGCQINEGNAPLFSLLLDAVCIALSKKIARDGEGATKLIEIQVKGAKREADAKKIALTIANSPLVKTALFGRDPNWGRIAMAAGRAGVEFDAANLSFSLGEVEMFRDGEPVAFDKSAAETVLESENVTIALDLGEGSARWTAWTCDFSYDYVKINAEYHT